MQEDFLHYIWKNKLFNPNEMLTRDGKQIEVVNPGIANNHAGPDFFNAKIKIDGTLWAGNVEIHNDGNEWYTHQHHTDEAYANVILHVVGRYGKEPITTKNSLIPEWQISYPDWLNRNYNELRLNDEWIACEKRINLINDFELSSWLQRMLIERLESKSELINRLLEITNNDWDQVFFITLCRSLGFGVNGTPFELLGKQMPVKILLKHSDNLLQLEALLLGQAGLLEESYAHLYINNLKQEYTFLKSKYGLKPMSASMWRFLRLRPPNFPTVRIAQLAALVHKLKGQFDQLLHFDKVQQLESKLIVVASEFWNTHYTLKKEASTKSYKELGINSVRNIIANAIIPYIFTYASVRKDLVQQNRALEAFTQLPSEKNSILGHWKKLSIKAANEGDAQALVFLFNNYCKLKKCLRCRIGHQIVSKRV